MPDSMAQQFIAALATLEDEKDAAPIAALYAEDAPAGNVIVPDRHRGPDGAREFWAEYRATFGEAKSTFRTVFETENGASLEWTTTGTVGETQSFKYAGVTILEFGDGKIARSCAYFDPSSLGRQMEETTAN